MRSPIQRIFGVGGVVGKSSIIAKNTFVSSYDSIINSIYSNDWDIHFLRMIFNDTHRYFRFVRLLKVVSSIIDISLLCSLL
jgi:uncharacterized protein YggT (Ycf19 family)